MHEGRSPVVYGDGSQTRDFTFVEDVVDAFLAAGVEDADGEVINICAGTETSDLELIAVVNDLLGTSLEPRFERARSGEVRRSSGDRSKAQRNLGWVPQFALRDALGECIATATPDPELTPR
jgi:nucleoside-diphosphate-sugar epimerase